MRAQFIENFPSLVALNYMDESQRSLDEQYFIEVTRVLLVKICSIYQTRLLAGILSNLFCKTTANKRVYRLSCITPQTPSKNAASNSSGGSAFEK
jgi:hypothetical protein